MSKKVAVVVCILILATAAAFSEVCTVHVWVSGTKWIATIDYGNGRIEDKEIGKTPKGALTDFIISMEAIGWKIEFYSVGYGQLPHHYFIFRK